MSRFDHLSRAERTALAEGQFAWLADHFGEAGQSFGGDDEGWIVPARLMLELAEAGAELDPYARIMADHARTFVAVISTSAQSRVRRANRA